MSKYLRQVLREVSGIDFPPTITMPRPEDRVLTIRLTLDDAKALADAINALNKPR